ncbi:DUF2207 domain-containing protein [Evansella cellulosilytica]|uniref:DUF2207 domain-containing protein n=1 Tax=Evansella cellulosilytica (strain ATCC 21833 / DSM 2522 / FERM P-1141 / JCM 9156 / N-4) TaxID=649639 RepID=E6U0M7_EVAC2|nr:DUF2207 domain-containing protein [Evansella cellulosilytica]ADU29075.1 Protein of unknown function DUF2207, membrane [Evansella cellulosilytica DSM 2522]
MFKKKVFMLTSITMLLLLLFVPSKVLAVDYTIDSLHIQAELLENGDVSVTETNIYTFNGEFNGIIRGLVPNQDINAEIIDLHAVENSEPLTIESDGYTHRIHRSGSDETIEITLTYTIKNGVQVYEDVGQFYWAFIDSQNESDYESLKIEVMPPTTSTNVSTDSVIAIGYDEAFEKEKIVEDGSVIFDLGKVRSNRDANIRVAYPSEFFPSAPLLKGELKETIIAEEEARYAAIQEAEEKREFYSSFGNTVLPLLAAVLFFIFLKDYLKYRSKQISIARELEKVDRPPLTELSLPATISLTNYHQLSSNAMAAALLDLVRKGNVKQVEEKTFELVHSNALLEHEEILIAWLFERVGDGQRFSLKQLKAYGKYNNNSSNYLERLNKWKSAIKKEINENNLYENKSWYRAMISSSSLFLTPLFILFGMNELFGYVATTGVIALAYLLYGIIYNPKTYKGSLIFYQWQQFKQHYRQLSHEYWDSWSEDEQMRAFLFALGIGEDDLKKKNRELLKHFEANQTHFNSNSAAAFDPTFSFYALALMSQSTSSSFQSTNNSLGSMSSGSSGSTFTGGGGGGVGGGGGGSGAF